MERQKNTVFEFSLHVLIWPLLFVLAIWTVFWFELRFGYDFNNFGVYPRTFTGLRGVFFSPFIHGDIYHLWHNTLPLLFLSMALFYFYPKIAWKTLVIGLLITGLGTWLLGRSSYHIGASGLIYMLFGFLFLKGILVKHYRLIALSFIVVFIYGSMIWYIGPVDPKISWEGHLSGLLAGIGLAVLQKQGVVKPPKYRWEHPEYNEDDDEFMQQFDENGNFAPKPPPEPESAIEEQPTASVQVRYHFKPLDQKPDT